MATAGATWPCSARRTASGDIVHSSNGAVATYQWALLNDLPVPGDYDGDGLTDRAVFRPSTATWYIVFSSSNSPVTIQWGLLNDVPVLKRP